eukprot:snap_masked-scaffold_46-processed-gene-0.22-mRNA-1 protein AED:1.00 eAED:1.00 QI:0/-1/0/0/-1/1/1/0/82
MDGQSISFRTRHMAAKHFYSRMIIRKRRWKLLFIRGSDNDAEIFTKPVSRQVYIRAVENMTWEPGRREEKRSGDNDKKTFGN